MPRLNATLAAAAALLLPLASTLPASAVRSLGVPIPEDRICLAPIDCPTLLPAISVDGLDDGCLSTCRHELLPPDFRDKLRRACRDCVAIEFCANAADSPDETTTFRRGAGEAYSKKLDGLIYLLAVQQRWYKRVRERDGVIELAELDALPRVRFLAADGSSLLELFIRPHGAGYVHWGHGYISLWELCRRCLPHPDADPAACAVRTDASPGDPLVPYTSPWGWKLEDKPVHVSESQTFCHVRMSPEENERLRRAFADCAELHMELWYAGGKRGGKHKLTLSRAQTKGFDERLRALAAVPQWLECRLYRNVRVTPACFGTIRLLDAKGKQLWEGSATHTAWQPHAGEPPVSLHAALEPYLPVKR